MLEKYLKQIPITYLIFSILFLIFLLGLISGFIIGSETQQTRILEFIKNKASSDTDFRIDEYIYHVEYIGIYGKNLNNFSVENVMIKVK